MSMDLRLVAGLRVILADDGGEGAEEEVAGVGHELFGHGDPQFLDFRLVRLQVLLELFGARDPYTPAFLRKSAETIEWKRDVKHSLGKERKEGRKRVSKREN
jgi:hypothetical protein